MHFLPHFILLTLIFSSPTSILAQNDPQTAYELLTKYDFPVGILPKGIINYEFDENTGKFSVFFKEDCAFNIFGHQYGLKYASTVKGYISIGRIYELEGVSFNMWIRVFDIVEVTRNRDLLYFYVRNGPRWTFPVRQFQTSPQCGCGYTCVDGTKPLLLQY